MSAFWRGNLAGMGTSKIGRKKKQGGWKNRKREMSKYLTTSPSSSSSAAALKCLPRCKFNKDKKFVGQSLFGLDNLIESLSRPSLLQTFAYVRWELLKIWPLWRIKFWNCCRTAKWNETRRRWFSSSVTAFHLFHFLAAPKNVMTIVWNTQPHPCIGKTNGIRVKCGGFRE